MEDRELLDSEKLVLYGLVRWAGTTDQLLAEKLGMKVPTVTSIRMKLRKRNLYSTHIVPHVQLFGSELLTISYVKFSSHPSLEEKLRQGRRVMNREEFFYSISEANQDFFMQFSRNYTEARRNIEDIEEAYKAISHLEEGIVSMHLPFALSEIPTFFDYAPLLAKTFALEKRLPMEGKAAGKSPGPPMTPVQDGGGGCSEPMPHPPEVPTMLSSKEKVVLYGLSKFPEMNDVEVSERISASRMTIGKTRKNLRSQSYMRVINVPNLEAIGFELVIVTHGRFNPALTEGLKFFIPGVMQRIGPSFFTAYGRHEILMMHAFPSFQEFKASTNELTQHYKEHEIFSSPPRRILFSLANMRAVKEHIYSPYLLKTFDLRKPDQEKETIE